MHDTNMTSVTWLYEHSHRYADQIILSSGVSYKVLYKVLGNRIPDLSEHNSGSYYWKRNIFLRYITELAFKSLHNFYKSQNYFILHSPLF